MHVQRARAWTPHIHQPTNLSNPYFTIPGARGKAAKGAKSEHRAPVFTARIVLLGAPSPEWAAGVRGRLLEEGK